MRRAAGKAHGRRGERRAQFYRNLHNGSFFAPKDDSGNWIEPFDPLKFGANGGNPFTEGNAWQYYWYVPHDVEGLISLTGGKKTFADKLDTFFTLSETSGEKNDNISCEIGQYAHGNEPSHHAAYLYNYAGQPLFDECTIHLPSGRDFTVTSNRSTAKKGKLKSITLNGRAFTDLRLTHADLASGSTLHFDYK